MVPDVLTDPASACLDFSRADFFFDHERNVYMCPGSAELTSSEQFNEIEELRALIAEMKETSE